MSAAIKISLTFLMILVLLRKKVGIGYVMVAGSAALILLFRMGIPDIFSTIRHAAVNPVTIELLLALSLIRMFEIILREKDVLSTMMTAVKGFFRSRRAVIVSMPMLIGMLPSLGGAYFSAPMVKEATSGLKMSPEEKAFVNYWFRHPWEYILPLYPGILLAAAVTHIPLYSLITANSTYSIVLLAMGFLISMRGIGPRTVPARAASGGAAKKGDYSKWLSFLPVFSVLFLVVAVHMELQYALLVIVVLLVLIYRYPPKEVWRITRHGFAPEVIILIFGVMLFKQSMESSGAVTQLSAFLVKQGIPVLPILCFLPFLTGLLTGLTVGFVGSTFPLLVSISGGSPVASMSLAFAAGFIGVLFSPVHLCLVLTREYFSADLRGVYKKIIPAGAFIFVAAFIEYMVMH
jgi:integral membrane protein (TIGR00529 family)